MLNFVDVGIFVVVVGEDSVVAVGGLVGEVAHIVVDVVGSVGLLASGMVSGCHSLVCDGCLRRVWVDRT